MVAAALVFATSCVSVDANGKASFSGNVVTASGNKISKTFNLGAFNSISSLGIQDVVITQGKTQSVIVKASDNIMKYCTLNVKNGVLNVSMTKEANSVQFKKFDMVVYVTMKDVKKISLSGTGDVKSKGNIKSDKLSLSLNGTGDIKLPSLSANTLTINLGGTGDIETKGSVINAEFNLSGTGDIEADLNLAKTLKTYLSGTGDMKLKGVAETAIYHVSGTGDVEARNFKAQNVEAYASGTGDITCYASESFKGSNNDINNIKCYGNPKNRDIKTKGFSFPK